MVANNGRQRTRKSDRILSSMPRRSADARRSKVVSNAIFPEFTGT